MVILAITVVAIVGLALLAFAVAPDTSDDDVADQGVQSSPHSPT
jgi:hypothetical protein